MYKSYKLSLSLSTFVCLFPFPRQKFLSQNLRIGNGLNNQTLWKDRPLHVDVLKLFCLNRCNFTESTKKLGFFSLFYMEVSYENFLHSNVFISMIILYMIRAIIYILIHVFKNRRPFTCYSYKSVVTITVVITVLIVLSCT